MYYQVKLSNHSKSYKDVNSEYIEISNCNSGGIVLFVYFFDVFNVLIDCIQLTRGKKKAYLHNCVVINPVDALPRNKSVKAEKVYKTAMYHYYDRNPNNPEQQIMKNLENSQTKRVERPVNIYNLHEKKLRKCS